MLRRYAETHAACRAWILRRASGGGDDADWGTRPSPGRDPEEDLRLCVEALAKLVDRALAWAGDRLPAISAPANATLIVAR